MAPLKFVVFICALVAVQAKPQLHPAVGSSIIDIIKDLLDPLEEIIDGSLDKVGELIGKLAKDTAFYQEKSVEVLGNAIEVVWANILTRLDRVKENGSADTKILVDCIEASAPESKEILLKLYGDSTKCLVPDVQEVFVLLDGLKPDVQKFKDDVFAALNQLKDCEGSDIDETICAAKVVKNVLEVVTKIPDSTLEEIKVIVDKSLNVIKNLPTCVKPNFEKFLELNIEHLNKVNACIRK
ncbi:hypothetical protein JTB14_005196 [Gonioctena quinquepunctata]|nr:hypothetical protein JTB14_005196 [Gonioctena quinquepunctata]